MNTLSVRALLVRGMVAGLIAGVLALAVAYVLGEPRIDASIAVEEAAAAHAHGAAHGADAAEELVSRTEQSTVGLATGILVFGIAIGGTAALAFAAALGRLGRLGARATAAVVAGAGLVAVYVIPFLKYPPAPPAVGDPDTVGERTALFFLMVALSLLLTVGAFLAGKRLTPRLGAWNATLAAGGGLLLAVVLAYAFLPSYEPLPVGFPANLLWQFRLASLAVQATLWAGFGLVFGYLAERLVEQRTAADAAPREPVAV
ncbi:CbtA family protein [Streptomyces sp. NPDC060194]|uniref:CbtA family protein n=1 Tax=Streptomyces sp. NPDC060194 TaxID=3347069 RepID=UPI00365F8421